MPPSSAPTSTYRLQVTSDLDLHRAAALVPYLRDLGVGWVYLSPLLGAEPGSDHGYDVVDHGEVDPSRGGAEGLAALSSAAREHGLGVLVDIVPNHVGVATAPENEWWWGLLQHGPESSYARAFDVDWEDDAGRIRIPVVGDDDQDADGGAISHLAIVGGELRYHDNRFPLRPGSLDDEAGDPLESPDPNQVHDRQHYELVSWRAADEELNYRRFFAVNTLAGIRVEDRRVFEASHREIRRWFEEDLVDGLRVDHPDGLRDPGGYLDDLAALTGGAYVLVEKILAVHADGSVEPLPREWATAGTTGYDALALLDRVLTDAGGQTDLDALETDLRGVPVDWEAMTHGTKRAVADGILSAEVRRITREVVPVLDGDRTGEPEDVVDAVAELLACFGVYRSYLPMGREHLEAALAEAVASRPELAEVLAEVAGVLADPAHDAALRFQQTSGMVEAKGVEDCAFYRYSRLTSLNEVGGEPSLFSLDAAAFHAAMAVRQADWPDAMVTLSTHDTKRGEDVRARITVLAECPRLWEGTLRQLLSLVPVPDAGFACLLWQAVVGCWPASRARGDLRERLHGYAEKAMREAGDHTQWTAPDEDYERAQHAVVDAALDHPGVRELLDSLLDRVVDAGWSNALAAKLVSLTMPGVPDVYQGSELWEQSLVDPDNRRPVDFDARVRLLAAGETPTAPRGLDDDGRAKLAVTASALRLRRERPELFSAYTPLAADGERAGHLLAFDRGGALTLATRLPLGLAEAGGWGATTLDLPAGRWRTAWGEGVFEGTVAVPDLLGDLPVALLVAQR